MVCYMQYRWTLNPVIPNDDDISICEDNYSVKSRTTIKSAKSGVSSSPPSKTKIIEENRTLMVNSDCPIQILIDYLATEMGFDKTRGFDFCNSDGDLIGINDLQKWENAKYIMPPDKTYIIVFTARNSFHDYIDFDIFLKKDTDIYNDYYKKLRKYILYSKLQSKSRSAPQKFLNFSATQTTSRAFSARNLK